MKLDMLYRSVISAFCFVAGGIALLAVIHGVLSLIFWSIPVVASIFCILWAGQSYLHYRWDDPEWQDRARILIRYEEDEEDDDE
jgi:hypothetical protein